MHFPRFRLFAVIVPPRIDNHTIDFAFIGYFRHYANLRSLFPRPRHQDRAAGNEEQRN